MGLRACKATQETQQLGLSSFLELSSGGTANVCSSACHRPNRAVTWHSCLCGEWYPGAVDSDGTGNTITYGGEIEHACWFRNRPDAATWSVERTMQTAPMDPRVDASSQYMVDSWQCLSLSMQIHVSGQRAQLRGVIVNAKGRTLQITLLSEFWQSTNSRVVMERLQSFTGKSRGRAVSAPSFLYFKMPAVHRAFDFKKREVR